MNIALLKNQWLKSEENQKNFTGWNFSYLENKYFCEEPNWDYRDIVLSYLKKEMQLLDMGTGGGELLATFSHPYENTSVTEGYLKNYRLLQKTLQTKGVDVQFVNEQDELNFSDDSFDIVINSHESFSISEVQRVLKPKGIFISQQVGDFNGVNLASRVIRKYKKDVFDFHLALIIEELEKNNFEILFQNEIYLKQEFYDMDGLIYYLRTIPWEFPDFSVENNFKELLSLHEELERNGNIFNLQHRFIFVCRNMK